MKRSRTVAALTAVAGVVGLAGHALASEPTLATGTTVTQIVLPTLEGGADKARGDATGLFVTVLPVESHLRGGRFDVSLPFGSNVPGVSDPNIAFYSDVATGADAVEFNAVGKEKGVIPRSAKFAVLWLKGGAAETVLYRWSTAGRAAHLPLTKERYDTELSNGLRFYNSSKRDVVLRDTSGMSLFPETVVKSGDGLNVIYPAVGEYSMTADGSPATVNVVSD